MEHCMSSMVVTQVSIEHCMSSMVVTQVSLEHCMSSCGCDLLCGCDLREYKQLHVLTWL